MNLNIENQQFIVCGASSGFGKAVSMRLIEEGGFVTGIARDKEKLAVLERKYSHVFQAIQGDLMDSETINEIEDIANTRNYQGLVLNAGGPPPGGALNPGMEDWDQSYQLVMRWKIDLVRRIVPLMRKSEYGRILFIESQSIKQPIPGLVLSNAFRAGIAGFAKTLSRELSDSGVTVNILAPGAHDTPAIERVISHKAEAEGITNEEARQNLEQNIPIGRMGKAEELSSLAVWLLSPLSSYITGQILSHEGEI